MIKRLFKKLFCKHDYKLQSQHMINAGMQKIFYYKCNKCGKTKSEIF